jgi:membrane protease YdiL (CAAX protease family)
MGRRRGVPWGWLDLVKTLALGLALLIVAAQVVGLARASLRALEQSLTHAGLSSHVFTLLLNSALVYVAIGAAMVLVIARPYRLSWAAFGYRPVSLARLSVVVLAYPATLIAADLVMALVIHYALHGQFTNPQAQEIAGGVTRTTANLLGLLLLVAVLAPLVEEAFFRGLLYQLLRKRLPVWAAAAISAALFAAAHAIPIIFPWLFVTGLALALIFEYCDSLFASMLLHGLINGGNVVLLFQTLPRH